MLHHIALEISPEDLKDEERFWLAAGFRKVPPPEDLGEDFTWYERQGTQIHLMRTTEPADPPVHGHVAVISENLDAAVERLKAEGFEVKEGRRLWGKRRVKVKTPAGHLVEIMAGPPAPASDTS